MFRTIVLVKISLKLNDNRFIMILSSLVSNTILFDWIAFDILRFYTESPTETVRDLTGLFSTLLICFC